MEIGIVVFEPFPIIGAFIDDKDSVVPIFGKLFFVIECVRITIFLPGLFPDMEAGYVLEKSGYKTVFNVLLRVE